MRRRRRRATTALQADWGQGVVRWREEKACTGTGLVHLGDPEHRYGWPSNPLSSLMLILVAPLLLLHYRPYMLTNIFAA